MVDLQTPLLWLEISGRCQLSCRHCYAGSGPRGGHGDLSDDEWSAIIDQAAELGFRQVTFIGGEPTLHPGLPALVRRSLRRGMRVVIYSNLLRLSRAIWEVAALSGVRLRTSYYSDVADEHDAITGVPGSHDRTTATIAEATRRGICVDAAVVAVVPGQRLTGAQRRLDDFAVTVSGPYRVRGIGRAARGAGDRLAELCGRCGDATLAVDPRGHVHPCVLARDLLVGDVRTTPLADILAGSALRDARQLITAVPRPADLTGTASCAP